MFRFERRGIMRHIVILLFLCLSLCAEEVDVSKLQDDDFDVREQYTKQLANGDFDNIKRYWDLAKTFDKKDPEVAYRLRDVCERLFRNNFIETDERILRIRGSLLAETTYVGLPVPKEKCDGGLLIKSSFPDSPLLGKLNDGDIIIKINEYSLVEITALQYRKFNFESFGFFITKSTVVLTFLRPKNIESFKDRSRVKENDDFEVHEASITIGDLIEMGSYPRVEKLVKEEWNNYKISLDK